MTHSGVSILWNIMAHSGMCNEGQCNTSKKKHQHSHCCSMHKRQCTPCPDKHWPWQWLYPPQWGPGRTRCSKCLLRSTPPPPGSIHCAPYPTLVSPVNHTNMHAVKHTHTHIWLSHVHVRLCLLEIPRPDSPHLSWSHSTHHPVADWSLRFLANKGHNVPETWHRVGFPHWPKQVPVAG